MKSRDGATVSTWKDIGPTPRHDAPPDGTHADVVIVGAGMSGLTTAYRLAREGKRVIVLDEGPIGSGQTERTTAHLASANDDRFYEVERHHGVEGSRISYESNAAAIDAIEQHSRDEGIDCDFARLDGYLFLIPGESPDTLDKELAASHRAGFADAQRLDRVDLPGCAMHGPCLKFPRQGRFHPLKYLYGLAAAIERRGGRIYTGCRVTDAKGADPTAGRLATATIDGGRAMVTGDAIVVATNTPAPINQWFGIYTKQHAYRTYVLAVRVPRGSVADALYWDDGDPYHYVRLEASDPASVNRDYDLLLVGGEDHKTGQLPDGQDPFANLLAWTREHFPAVGGGSVERIWSGQVQEPADYLPYIGRAPRGGGDNVFVATGDSGMGMTHGTIAGLLLADLIQGRENPWAAVYDPARKTLDYDFVSENLNTAAQYKDLVTGGDVRDVSEIAPGHGRVMREGLKKVAVYRDEGDKIHKCSAVCTHLGCIVQWNPIEQSWDCPCHGSRFDPYGRVVMGPAVSDLGKVE